MIRKVVKLAKNIKHKDAWWKDEPFVKIDRSSLIWAKSNGFLASSAFVYGVPRKNPSDWLNEKSYRKGHPYNGAFSRLIDDKTFLPIVFQKNKKFLPRVLISLTSGSFDYAIGVNKKESVEKTISDAIKIEGDLFAKRVGGSGGVGCHLLSRKNLGRFLNREARGGRFLITSTLRPRDYLEEIAGPALSTMRVVFFKPEGCSTPVVLKVIQRFPTSESGFVDNCDAGGMASAVNLEDGSLGKAIIYGSKSNNGWHSLHPDTGKCIEGVVIPSWEQKLSTIEEALGELFFLSYGGLDIADTTEGMKVIEINSLPTPKLTQLDGPVLKNSAFKDFMIKKGYN